MKKISLNNFLKMSPEAPQFTEKNQHYLLSGVNPTYYNDTIGIQEEQIAPLIASNKWFPYSGFSDPIIDIVDSLDTNSAYAMKGTSEVYAVAITPTAITPTSCGLPSGSAQATSVGKLKCFANKLLAITAANDNHIYYKALPATGGSWSTFSGTLTSATAERFLENFLEFCMVSDNGSLIKKLDSGNNILTGIDLGAGWSILDMRNYNDKYLAIAGANGNFNNNYLFLWNGRDDRYNYSVKMAGKFLDMKVIDGILYVAVWCNGTGNTVDTGKTILYYLKGTKLVRVVTPQISSIGNGYKKGIFGFQNKVGLNLDSHDLLIYDKSDVGTEEFVLSSDLPFTKFTETSDGFILGVYSSGTGSGFAYYQYNSTTFNQILYKSQWIPVKNLQGIDTVYDTPPQSGTDAINVTIYGKGEDIITGNSTTVLDSITPTNFLNETRTRLDVKGFTGDKIKIQLTTVNNSSWRPIIRSINLITQ